MDYISSLISIEDKDWYTHTQAYTPTPYIYTYTYTYTTYTYIHSHRERERESLCNRYIWKMILQSWKNA